MFKCDSELASPSGHKSLDQLFWLRQVGSLMGQNCGNILQTLQDMRRDYHTNNAPCTRDWLAPKLVILITFNGILIFWSSDPTFTKI